MSLDAEFSEANALYLTDYISVISDFFGDMKPADSEVYAKWFVPSSVAMTLLFVNGYEIGLGAEYKNIWRDMWSALDPIREWPPHCSVGIFLTKNPDTSARSQP